MNAPVEMKLPEKIAGYRTFTLGQLTFQRDEYFVTITWPAKGQRQSHTMSADAFLRAIMRDVAWGFFYGLVNFDAVFGYAQFVWPRGAVRRPLQRSDPQGRGCPMWRSSIRRRRWPSSRKS